MSLFEAIIIAIVEGLTEFLPISSTGHMIITSTLLGIEDNDFTKLFEVSIQLGAILAVVVLYWKKFIQLNRWQFYVKLIIGILPVLVLGFIFKDYIKAMLGSTTVVAVSMLTGGFILLFIDRLFQQPAIESEEQITYKNSFLIGCWQVISMIPGVSRSAASIIGGMQQKLSRNVAAEFSFFLAVPTMCAASLYSLFLDKWNSTGVEKRGYELIGESSQHVVAFIVGNIVAFVVAMLAIKFFINFLKAYGFKVFGIYRIITGAVLLILIAMGYLK